MLSSVQIWSKDRGWQHFRCITQLAVSGCLQDSKPIKLSLIYSDIYYCHSCIWTNFNISNLWAKSSAFILLCILSFQHFVSSLDLWYVSERTYPWYGNLSPTALAVRTAAASTWCSNLLFTSQSQESWQGKRAKTGCFRQRMNWGAKRKAQSSTVFSGNPRMVTILPWVSWSSIDSAQKII